MCPQGAQIRRILMENHINLNLEPNQYAKKVKEAEEYKKRERRYDEPITHELDEYMKKLSIAQRIKPNRLDKKEPSGIIVDFMRITNHTIEDITLSLNKSANKLIEDMTYSILNAKHRVLLKDNYTAKVIGNEREYIKLELKSVDIKTELGKASKIDKELYKNLESIKRITDRKMNGLNSTYESYNGLLNMANKCNLNLGYDQRMSGIKVYGESKRSIEADQAELVSIVKGETKDQKDFKSVERSMNYIDTAEKKIESINSQNKFLDIRGNMERNKTIKEIYKEIESQKQVLKENGINSKEEFSKLKEEVLKREHSVKKLIESENTKYKEELKEIKKEEKLLKQKEQKIDKQLESNSSNLQNARDKKGQLERK